MARTSLVIVLLLGVVLPVAAGDASLPDVECVRALRRVRIAQINEDDAQTVVRLREASEACPDQPATIGAWLDYQRRHSAPEEEVARLRAALQARLADPEQPLPAGTVQHLIESDATDAPELELVLETIRARFGSTEDPAMLDLISTLEENLGHPDEAHRTLQRLLALRPDPATQWRCLGLDREAGRWDEAAEHLGHIVGESPGPLLRSEYIVALARSRRYDELLRQLDAVERWIEQYDYRARESVTDVILGVAWELRDQGEDERAEAVFRRLLARNPDLQEARQALRYLYSTADERASHDAALREKWATESDPDALIVQGASMLAGGDAEGALALLERGAAALPDSEPAQFNLGLAAIRLERWEIAGRALEAATRLNPGRAETRLNYGIALTHLERHTEAIVELERALAERPDLLQAHFYLYVAYGGLGDSTKAAEHLDLYNASVEPAE